MKTDDDSSTTSGSTTSEESDHLEQFAEDMDTFKEQIHALYVVTEAVGQQLLHTCERAVREEEEYASEASTIAALEGPQCPTPAVKIWLLARGCANSPRYQEFLSICLDAAESLDLATRMVRFSVADAAILTEGRCELSVFELISRLPMWFC